MALLQELVGKHGLKVRVIAVGTGLMPFKIIGDDTERPDEFWSVEYDNGSKGRISKIMPPADEWESVE